MAQLKSDDLLVTLTGLLNDLLKEKPLPLMNVQKKIIVNEVAASLQRNKMDSSEFLDNPANKQSIFQAFFGQAMNQAAPRQMGAIFNFNLDEHFKKNMRSKFSPEPKPGMKKNKEEELEDLLLFFQKNHFVFKFQPKKDQKEEKSIELSPAEIKGLAQAKQEDDQFLLDMQWMALVTVLNYSPTGARAGAHAMSGATNVIGIPSERPPGFNTILTDIADAVKQEQAPEPQPTAQPGVKVVEENKTQTVEAPSPSPTPTSGWPPNPLKIDNKPPGST